MTSIDPARAPLPIDLGDWEDDGGALAGRARRDKMGMDTMLEFARGRLAGLVEDARDSLVAQVRGLKSLTDLLADNLGDTAPPVRRLASDAGGTIESIADALSQKSVEELVEDGRALVRTQPAAAVGIAIALGFLAGRMVKAARE